MKSLAKTAILILLCCFGGSSGYSGVLAELKVQVEIDAGVIKVGDLWENAGPKAGTVIGAAPPPGRSIEIGAAQLAYIAHLYDVEWKPVSRVERSVVERAGRPLTRDEMAAPIQRSLTDAGASPTITIELANFAPILVPPASFPLISVEALNYDPATDRFSADLIVSTEGMQTQRMRVDGKALDMVTAVVASQRLDTGDVILPAFVHTMQVPKRRLSGRAVTDVSQVVGQTPRHTIALGQPLVEADVGPPLMVQKGSTVVILLETANMSLAAQGLALSSGGRGDEIQVMNPLSRSVVVARVTGVGKAVVLSGSSPIVPPSRVVTRNTEVAN